MLLTGNEKASLPDGDGLFQPAGSMTAAIQVVTEVAVIAAQTLTVAIDFDEIALRGAIASTQYITTQVLVVTYQVGAIPMNVSHVDRTS